MTDDTRLDALLRGALAQLPVPDDEQTRVALDAVLDRGGRRSRMRGPGSRLVPALVAAAMVLVLGISAFVAQHRDQTPSPAPAPDAGVVGVWERQVSGARTDTWDGHWSMTLAADGVLTLQGPATATDSSEGASYSLESGRLRSDAFVNSACPEQAAGMYDVTTTSTTLSLQRFYDPCQSRVDLFAGTWQRVP